MKCLFLITTEMILFARKIGGGINLPLEGFEVRDRDIRTALKEELEGTCAGEPDTLIIDEVGLCKGAVRVDIAVVNGTFNGYEIKSERDTLERLPAQQEIYSKTFDTVTIVTSGRHVDKIMEQVPSWWGITQAVVKEGKIGFRVIRQPVPNPRIDPFSLAQLLWRDEAVTVLKEHGLADRMLSKPRRSLWQKIADNLSIEELREVVRERLKARGNWRVVQ